MIDQTSPAPIFGAASVVVRQDGVIDAPIHGELIVTQSDDDAYFALEGSAKEIWKLLESPTTFATLCDRLSSAYPQGGGLLERDVVEFLEELHEANLIRIVV